MLASIISEHTFRAEIYHLFSPFDLHSAAMKTHRFGTQVSMVTGGLRNMGFMTRLFRGNEVLDRLLQFLKAI
jgi:hypothetical protein